MPVEEKKNCLDEIKKKYIYIKIFSYKVIIMNQSFDIDNDIFISSLQLLFQNFNFLSQNFDFIISPFT